MILSALLQKRCNNTAKIKFVQISFTTGFTRGYYSFSPSGFSVSLGNGKNI